MEDEIEIDQLKNTLIDNAKFLREIYNEFGDVNKDDELKKLLSESIESRLNNIAELVELKVTHKAQNSALQSAKNSSTTVEELEKNFSEFRTATVKKRVKVKNMADYKEAKKLLKGTNQVLDGSAGIQDNDEIEMVTADGDVFSLYDPWSKVLLRNPVKNSICGHIYDRDSVKEVIKDNISIRCPILGCNNRNIITPSHLIVDEELCRRVQECLANESREGEESDEE